jgi:hypothetical protein
MPYGEMGRAGVASIKHKTRFIEVPICMHAARVWLIVGYIRCALEPFLKGVRWETRLHARHDAMPGNKELQHSDRSLFNGHMFILDVINVGLFVVLANACYNTWTTSSTPGQRASALLLTCVPAGIVLYFFFIRQHLRRGQSVERDHYESWLLPTKDDTTTLVCAAKPEERRFSSRFGRRFRRLSKSRR